MRRNTKKADLRVREFGKLYQDPLYGAQTLSPLAVAVMDTPEFQRLDGLKQLGFSNMAYRGARHSRLEHSIGTYLICKQIMRRIVQNHERFGLEHPGSHISARYSWYPANFGPDRQSRSYQSRWRGLMELLSIAALLHDLGHVPFGHTLEDEFAGIFGRHDRLGGPRLYEMLFSDQSKLARVFTRAEPWLPDITNEEVRALIYLTLSWKERVTPPRDFSSLLKARLNHLKGKEREAVSERVRLESLQRWHTDFFSETEPMFQPFMSDIIGNTICADLLDYLPRDRSNLGMEYRRHERLQRYFTIRRGTLHSGEGYRMSIMVTRKGHGGQRRDVASAVLDIMRERFEMAEAVYYHHKKAAASAMLAKLAELLSDVEQEQAATDGVKKLKPRDDDLIYPAPWTSQSPAKTPPHMTHLSDTELIDYLGTTTIELADTGKQTYYRRLQRQLYVGLRYHRAHLYRTLLVIDTDLADKSNHLVSYFVNKWRGPEDSPSNTERRDFERRLCQAANAQEGDVIVYCPAETMQSKEIDARVEIQENRIVPLRSQRTFVYNNDVEALKTNYESLWRAYIFVTPEIFEDRSRCEAVVRQFCNEYKVRWEDARRKVRRHDYDESDEGDLITVPQPELPLDHEFEFNVDEIFAKIEPFFGDHPDRPQLLKKSLVRFTTRANKHALPERLKIENRLSRWIGSLETSGFANRLSVRTLTEKLDEIVDEVAGPPSSEKAK